jgi:hypothetical protein
MISNDTLKFYFNTNKDFTGMSVMGSGFIHGNDLYSMEVKCATPEEATAAFEHIAKLM